LPGGRALIAAFGPAVGELFDGGVAAFGPAGHGLFHRLGDEGAERIVGDGLGTPYWTSILPCSSDTPMRLPGGLPRKSLVSWTNTGVSSREGAGYVQIISSAGGVGQGEFLLRTVERANKGA
jgi:hypothetical protein